MVTACLTCGDKLLDEAFRYCDKCAATVCETCGVRGFEKALVYCDNCQVYASHRYCFKEMPAIADEYVVWLCADCESKTLNSSELSIPCFLSNEKSVSDEVELIQNSSKKRKRKGKRSKEKNVGSALAEPEPEPRQHSNCSDLQLIENESSGGGGATEILGNNDSPVRLEVVLIRALPMGGGFWKNGLEIHLGVSKRPPNAWWILEKWEVIDGTIDGEIH